MKKVDEHILSQWNSLNLMDLIPLTNYKPKQINGFLVDGHLYDIRDCLTHKSSNIFIVEKDDEYGIEISRHSMAHLLAQSLLQLFPSAKIAVGPTTESGFFMT